MAPTTERTSMADVVKCTVWLADLDYFERFNPVYERAFPPPRPTRATVGAALLGGIKVEIDAVACVSERSGRTQYE
jgi:2-iminobutanoate/2-iminopropanoate deaminase